MKKIKGIILKILGLIITFAIVFGVRTFLTNMKDNVSDKIYSDNVEGHWAETIAVDSENKSKKLKNIEFTDEEIEIVKYIRLCYVINYDFNEDGTYSQYYDKEKSLNEAEKYLDQVFETLYENRSKINDHYKEKYKMDLNDLDLDEFLDKIAVLYGVKNYNELPELLIESMYNIDTFDKVIMEGTYLTDSNRITFEDSDTYVTYTLKDDNTLVLNYSDGDSTLKRRS